MKMRAGEPSLRRTRPFCLFEADKVRVESMSHAEHDPNHKFGGSVRLWLVAPLGVRPDTCLGPVRCTRPHPPHVMKRECVSLGR